MVPPFSSFSLFAYQKVLQDVYKGLWNCCGQGGVSLDRSALVPACSCSQSLQFPLKCTVSD